MVLMYVLSQKGENLLVHNHFIHRKEKTINENVKLYFYVNIDFLTRFYNNCIF